MLTAVVRSREDLAVLIRQAGILPFFANPVAGWSLEEHIDPAVWFTDREGPWEWKGQLASDKTCVYGKFVRNKAAFVSPEWFAELANWRRDGYDWEGRVDDGITPYKDRLLMAYLAAHPRALSRRAKRECGFTKGYDTVVTRLQMQTYIVLADFQYDVTRAGVPYGWGNAVIDLADRCLNIAPAQRPPQASFERMIAHLTRLMPEADEGLLRKELK